MRTTPSWSASGSAGFGLRTIEKRKTSSGAGVMLMRAAPCGRSDVVDGATNGGQAGGIRAGLQELDSDWCGVAAWPLPLTPSYVGGRSVRPVLTLARV